MFVNQNSVSLDQCDQMAVWIIQYLDIGKN